VVSAAPSGHAFTGTVTHADASAYPGVTVTATTNAKSAVTDGSGDYSIADCADGAETLTPTLPSGDAAPHNMTAYNAPSPYVVTQSAGTGYLPFTSGGGDWNTSGVTGWLEIDLGAASHIVTNYSIRGTSYGTNTGTYGPNAWVLEGSNDGSTWDLLDTVTGQTGWTVSEVRNFTCDAATTAYRYYRYTISANNGADHTATQQLYLYYAGTTETWSPATRTPTMSGADVTGQNFTVGSSSTDLSVSEGATAGESVAETPTLTYSEGGTGGESLAKTPATLLSEGAAGADQLSPEQLTLTYSEGGTAADVTNLIPPTPLLVSEEAASGEAFLPTPSLTFAESGNAGELPLNNPAFTPKEGTTLTEVKVLSIAYVLLLAEGAQGTELTIAEVRISPQEGATSGELLPRVIGFTWREQTRSQDRFIPLVPVAASEGLHVSDVHYSLGVGLHPGEGVTVAEGLAPPTLHTLVQELVASRETRTTALSRSFTEGGVIREVRATALVVSLEEGALSTENLHQVVRALLQETLRGTETWRADLAVSRRETIRGQDQPAHTPQLVLTEVAHTAEWNRMLPTLRLLEGVLTADSLAPTQVHHGFREGATTAEVLRFALALELVVEGAAGKEQLTPAVVLALSEFCQEADLPLLGRALTRSYETMIASATSKRDVMLASDWRRE
jgi:hypothetical protein